MCLENTSGLHAYATPGMGARLASVRARVAAAARRSGRDPAEVTLLAISKMQPVEALFDAFVHGQRLFGENYVQEALAKQAAFATRFSAAGSVMSADDMPVWHFTGHLQKNKAKDVAGGFALVHTVDSLELAHALSRRLPEAVAAQAVLMQVNIGHETQKSGVAEDALLMLAEKLMTVPRLSVQGLMCVPPFFDGGDAVRPYFARMRALAERARAALCMPLPILSMGMSGDFEEAIEEGATLVRVGSSLFGPRARQAE